MLYNFTKFLITICLFAIVIPTSAQDFKFKKKIGKYVFKPKKGKLNYNLQFDEVTYSTYGYWKVRNGEDWGVFTEDKLIIEPKFEEIQFLRNERALVKLNDKFGVINFNGTQEIDFIIDQVDHFSKNSNMVKVGDQWGIIIEGKFTAQKNPIFQNPNHPPIIKECENKEEDCYEIVFVKKIGLELRYPQDAQSKGIEGKVILRLIINKVGKLEDIEILKELGGGCTEEAIRIAKEFLSEWVPAMHDGVSVKSQYFLPIRFRL